MTDRELLKWAAKAAEYELCWFEVGEGDPDCEAGWYCTNVTRGGIWNPLIDDGDALRLAVRLRINVEHQTTMGGKPAGFNVWPVGRGDCAAVEDGNDPQDLRRAIVRAAAEIGKAM